MLDPLGRFTSPLPPSAGPLGRPSGQNPRSPVSKLRSPATFPAEPCKNPVPQARSLRGSLWDSFGESVLGLRALATGLWNFETGLQTLKIRLRSWEVGFRAFLGGASLGRQMVPGSSQKRHFEHFRALAVNPILSLLGSKSRTLIQLGSRPWWSGLGSRP